MADTTLITARATETARRLQPRLWPLVWLGLALLLAGIAAPQGRLSLGLTTASTTIFALALAIILLARRHRQARRHNIAIFDRLVGDDAVATLLSGADGAIAYGNRAAHAQFGSLRDASILRLVARHVSNPVSLIFQLQNRARRQGPVQKYLVTANGHVALSVRYVSALGYVWRIDPQEMLAARGREIALPMMTVTPEGEILSLNRAMLQLLGHRPRHLDRVFHDPPLRAGQVHRIAGARGTVSMRVLEYRRDSPPPPGPDDGHSPLDAGRKEGVIPGAAATPDLMPGRTGNAALRELYLVPAGQDEPDPRARLFDDLPVALLRLSARGTLLRANRLARPLLGRFAEGQTKLTDLVQGLGRPVGDWLREAAEGRVAKRPEVVLLRNGRHDVYLQIALSRIVEDGEVSLIAVLHDATELKTLEAQFVQSQKMQAIGQLAGGVAHDFNNLLTAISGHCDLLLLRHDEGDPDYGDLIQITQNANRAASLVSQLLAFSRKQNLQPEEIDLRDALSDLSHLLNRLLGEKVVLRVVHGKGAVRVRADRRHLEQVLMNLVVNARDAMPGGGEVRIETANLHLAREMNRERAIVPAGDYVVIRVCDNGTGIAPDRLEKIFEPFYTTKKTGEGTGLGLSMVYGIVKQTGGFIFVESAPGQGSIFEILLPAHDRAEDALPDSRSSGVALAGPAEAASLVPVARPPTGGGCHDPANHESAGGETPVRDEGVILLVEDEAPVRAFAARALRMRGYEVIEAEDAEQALKLLSDESLAVDLFITDVIMPGKDGPTWVREALARRPQARVIFVSGYAEESFSTQQAEIRNSVFLPKPFSLQELTDRVRAQMAVARDSRPPPQDRTLSAPAVAGATSPPSPRVTPSAPRASQEPGQGPSAWRRA